MCTSRTNPQTGRRDKDKLALARRRQNSTKSPSLMCATSPTASGKKRRCGGHHGRVRYKTKINTGSQTAQGAPKATTAAPRAAIPMAATMASVTNLDGVFILSGDVASSSGGTEGSCASHDLYRSSMPWCAAPFCSRARYLRQTC